MAAWAGARRSDDIIRLAVLEDSTAHRILHVAEVVREVLLKVLRVVESICRGRKLVGVKSNYKTTFIIIWDVSRSAL